MFVNKQDEHLRLKTLEGEKVEKREVCSKDLTE